MQVYTAITTWQEWFVLYLESLG